MKKLLLVTLALTVSQSVFADWSNIQCGIKPLPPYGCRVVCMDGQWHTICD